MFNLNLNISSYSFKNTISIHKFFILLFIAVFVSSNSLAQSFESHDGKYEYVTYPWKTFFSNKEAQNTFKKILSLLIKEMKRKGSPFKKNSSNKYNTIEKLQNYRKYLNKFSHKKANSKRDFSFLNLAPDGIVIGLGGELKAIAGVAGMYMAVLLPVVVVKINKKTGKIESASLKFRMSHKSTLEVDAALEGKVDLLIGVGPYWYLRGKNLHIDSKNVYGKGFGGEYMVVGTAVGASLSLRGAWITNSNSQHFFYFLPTLEFGANTITGFSAGYRHILNFKIPWLSDWLARKLFDLNILNEKIAKITINKIPKNLLSKKVKTTLKRSY